MSVKSYQTDVKKIKFVENNEKLTSFSATYENSNVVYFTSLCKELLTKQLDDRSLLTFNHFSNTSKVI